MKNLLEYYLYACLKDFKNYFDSHLENNFEVLCAFLAFLKLYFKIVIFKCHSKILKI